MKNVPTRTRLIHQSTGMFTINLNFRYLHNSWETLLHNGWPLWTPKSLHLTPPKRHKVCPPLTRWSPTRPLSLNSLKTIPERNTLRLWTIPPPHLSLQPSTLSWRRRREVRPPPFPLRKNTPFPWRARVRPLVLKELARYVGRRRRNISTQAFPLALQPL